MKEATIRKKAIEVLNKKGYICWYPPKVRYRKETDIFGVYDIVAIKSKNKSLFIQITTLSNIRAREKKIRAFLDKNRLKFYSEAWGYCKKKKQFKILPVE